MINEFNPRVSIIIPVYNGSDYLREAIDSALAQTYENREVIVVNDGSTDGGKTETISRSYGNKIRYLYKENGGVSSALNTGIREMSGEYVSWLSHDDVYLEDKLEVQVNILKKYAGPVILYSDFYVIDGKSRVKSLRRVRHEPADHFIHALITSSPVNGCTTLIPRSCFDDVGFFYERLRTTQDYDMWARLSKKYQFIHLPKALVKYRVHGGQGTRTLSDVQVAEANDFYIQCLNDYSLEDIFGPGESSAAISYLRLAANFKTRGFIPAFHHALRLANNNVSKSGMTRRVYEQVLFSLLKAAPKGFLLPYWKFKYDALAEYATAVLPGWLADN